MSEKKDTQKSKKSRMITKDKDPSIASLGIILG